jgi:hypothetical protein
LSGSTSPEIIAMRALAAALSGLLLSAAASSAFAAGPTVNVSIGPDLQKKAASYGAQEFDLLRTDLRKSVERALSRRGAQPVQRVDLTIEAATPNRPTFNQLRQPGLSLSSIGVGGAAISGQVVGADGVARPISYHWFETDLRNEVGAVTWSDADRAFDHLASTIARGDLPNQAAYRPGPHDGDFGPYYR